MAQELNFDELDHAVNQYMQRKEEKPAASSAVPARPQVSVAPRQHASSVNTSSTEPQQSVSSHTPHDTSHAEERPTMRIAPRRAIAPRPLGNRSTFHDIAPPRRAPASSSTHLQPSTTPRPVAERPVPTAQPTKSADRPTTPRFTDIAPSRPAPEPATVEPINKPESIQPSFAAEAQQETPARVLGEPAVQEESNSVVGAESFTEEKPQEPTTAKAEEVKSSMAFEPAAPFTASSDWSLSEPTPEDTPTEQADFSGVSDAAQSSETPTAELPASDTDAGAPAITESVSEVPTAPIPDAEEPQGAAQDLASLDKITARPPQQSVTFGNSPEARVASEQKTEWPSTAGLLDTGELHTPAMLPADDRGMNHQNTATVGQVFDTKPYHAPIQGGNGSMSRGRTMIIITLIVVFVLIAAVAVFMYVS